MVKLADETKNICIGSGGIMLPNHSALKVAENFRMLETLFPGRIDLGMGRAPGGDRITATLLNPSNTFSEESYLRELEYLQHFFNDTAATAHGPIIAVPKASTIPCSGSSALVVEVVKLLPNLEWDWLLRALLMAMQNLILLKCIVEILFLLRNS